MPPRTRSNRADFEESPTKETRYDAPSTDESDIEVDLEESSLVQVISLKTSLFVSPIGAIELLALCLLSEPTKIVCRSGS